MQRPLRACSSLLALALLVAVGCTEQPTSPLDIGQISPSIVPGISSVGELSAGGYHACVLKTDGTVTCWGSNASTQSTPPAGLVAVQVSSGQHHTCARRADGTVSCWGDNSWGELNVPAGLLASQVAAGTYQTCAVRTDATVACWGGDTFGQSTVPAG